MVGGILQLFAKNTEDIVLTKDPEMTHFKIVYRRHINFSKESKKLTFSSRPDFNKKCVCRLRTLGDFIGQLYVVIKIPEINIKYKILKVKDIRVILEKYNITWSTSALDTDVVTDLHLVEVKTLIDSKKLALENERETITSTTNDDILKTIDSVYDDSSVTDENFFEELLNKIIQFDDNYKILYEFLNAYRIDETTIDNSFTNISQLRTIIFDKIKETVIPDDGTSFHDENINMLDVINRNTFPIKSVETGILSKTHFINTLANLYNGVDSLYTLYDSYKIIEQLLDSRNTKITSPFFVNDIKTDIYNHIVYDIGKNIQLLIKVYFSIGLDYRFTFYKRYLYNTLTKTNSPNEEFINLSTTNLARFNDNFTKNFELGPIEGEPDNLIHFYSTYVNKFITAFHVNNKNYFRFNLFDDYFGKLNLWKKMDLTTIVTGLDDALLTAVSNVYVLNLVPIILINDMETAFNYLSGTTFEIVGTSEPNLIGITEKITQFITPLVAALKTEIKYEDIISTEEITLLSTLSGIYKKNIENDVFVVSFFKFYKYFKYKSTLYNVMEYLKQIFTNRTLNMIINYNDERSKLIINCNLSWFTITDTITGNNDTKRQITFTINVLNGTQFSISGTGYYFFLYAPYDTTKYVLWYNLDSANTAPVITDTTTVEIAISSSDTSTGIAVLTANAIHALSDFTSTSSNNIVTIDNITTGICTLSTLSNMPQRMTFQRITEGSLTVNGVIKIIAQPAANYISSGTGSYFIIYSHLNLRKYVVWLRAANGVYSPSLLNFTELEVDIRNDTTADEVALSISTVINAQDDFTTSISTNEITVTNVANGITGPADIGVAGSSNHNAVKGVVDMFFMTEDQNAVLTETILPEFEKYKSNSLSLFQISSPAVRFLNPLSSTTDEALVIDAPSSIWYNIYTNMINNYNNFYDKEVLQNSYIDKFLGKNVTEFKAYIDKNETANIMKPLVSGDGDNYNIDYYLATKEQTDKITDSNIGYLSLQLNSLNNLITKYDKNKNVLKISNATLDLNNKLFESYANMVVVIRNLIYNTYDPDLLYNSVPNTGYEHDPELINFPAIETSLISLGIVGIMDKFNSLQTIKEYFYDVTNDAGSLTPLILEVKTSVIYNQYIKNIAQSIRISLKQKYDNLFSTYTSNTFYNDINVIVNSYNSFKNESDLYNYMINIVRKASMINSIIDLKGISRIDTRDKVKKYYNDRIATIDSILLAINGNNNGIIPLYTTINGMKNGSIQPKFAWIKYLGYYIIKNSYINIGGEIIDKQSGDWLYINNELTSISGKEVGNNKIIGNIPQLFTYNNTKKNSTTLYIPLNHWFCNKPEYYLPLVAMNHTYVDLHIDFSELSDCAYWEDLTYFKKRPQLSAYVLADYYFIESSERKKLVKAKHELLIETIQTHHININYYDLVDKTYDLKVHLTGACKEYIWFAQKNTYADGTYLSPQITKSFNANGLVVTTENIKRKSLHYYGKNEDGSGNPIEKVKVIFNGVIREQFKDSMFYDTVYPYKCHTRSPADGIMCYPLCLYPELVQPSGTANHSKISTVELGFIIDKDVYDDMKNNNLYLKIVLFGKTYNWLRIFSGMAGAAFYE